MLLLVAVAFLVRRERVGKPYFTPLVQDDRLPEINSSSSSGGGGGSGNGGGGGGGVGGEGKGPSLVKGDPAASAARVESLSRDLAYTAV